MKKFNFSLEKVYQYKGQTLDALKNEQATIVEEIRRIGAQIVELEATFEKTNNELTEKFSSGITPNDITVYKMYLSKINALVLQYVKKKQVIEQRLEEKRKEILKVNQEIKSLGTLKDKQLAEYKKTEQKSQELFINEFVSSLHVSKSFN